MLFLYSSSATNRLIGAKDHASVQINIGDVDETGRYTGSFTTYALSGYVRAQSEADDSINRLATKDGCTLRIFDLGHTNNYLFAYMHAKETFVILTHVPLFIFSLFSVVHGLELPEVNYGLNSCVHSFFCKPLNRE